MLSPEQLAFVEEVPTRFASRISLLRNWYLNPVYEKLGKDYKLNQVEVSVLGWIGNHRGIRAQDIATITSRPKNTVSHAIAALTRKRLVSSKSDMRDRRQKVLVLTRKGEKICRAFRVISKRRENELLAQFTVNQLGDLDLMLDHAVKTLLAPQTMNASMPARPRASRNNRNSVTKTYRDQA